MPHPHKTTVSLVVAVSLCSRHTQGVSVVVQPIEQPQQTMRMSPRRVSLHQPHHPPAMMATPGAMTMLVSVAVSRALPASFE